MPDGRALTTASQEDLEQALAHALRFDSRKHFKLSGESMVRITAAHLVECRRRSGSVIIRERRARNASTAAKCRERSCG
jgi:hypothetical protein